MSILWRKIEKSLDRCPIRNVENRQIEQFREKERTAPPGKVELLQTADFYGILICRKGAVLQVQRSCFPPDVKSGGSSFLSSSGWFDCTHMKTQRRKSNMDILSIVFSALNLLATVVIGVINVTWMISRDVFRDKPRAKHYSKKWQEKWPPVATKLRRSFFLVNHDIGRGSWPLCGQRLSLSLL